MNERIQKLYDQADKFAKENRTQTISGPGNNYFELFHEKFAELIVAECISTLEEKIYRSIDHEGDEIWIDLILKEHFGVEE
jgi:hypothetical protein